MKRQTYDGVVCGIEGNYGIVFPDFMGCISAGDTLGEVAEMGHEALQLHVEGMAEANYDIPEPRRYTLDEVIALLVDPDDPVEEEWVCIIPITVDVPQADDVVTLEFPVSLVNDLDAVGVDRRRFIIDATRRELLRLKRPA